MKNRIVLVALGIVACGGESTDALTNPSPEALSVTIESGNAQSGVVASELPQPVSVVVERSGQPGDGTVVNFVVVTDGGGRPFAGTAVADRDGIATDIWELGNLAGEHRMEVRTVDPDGTPRVWGTFRATARPGPAATLEYTMPDTTLFLVGGPAVLDISGFAARGVDEYGNEITDRSAAYQVDGALSVDGLTVTATQEAAGNLVVAMDAARDSASILAVHDLRTLGAARLELLCIGGRTLDANGAGAIDHDSARVNVDIDWSEGPPAYLGAWGEGTAVVYRSDGAVEEWEATLIGFSPTGQSPGEIRMGESTALQLVAETTVELVYEAEPAALVDDADPCENLRLLPPGYPHSRTLNTGRGFSSLTFDR